MAKEYSNGVDVATGFKIQGKNPVDDREQVETFSNLLDESSIISTDLRKWIEVIAADTGKKYQWNGNDRTQSSNWKLLGDDSVSPYSQTITGVLTGGEVTINGTSNDQFDIAAGTGIIVDWSDPANPIRTEVSWTEKLGELIPDINGIFTTISIDVNGNVVKVTDVAADPEARRERIFLQSITHQSHTQIDSVTNQQNPSYEVVNSLLDYVLKLGAINVGNTISANASANLTVDKSSGETVLPFINKMTNAKNPTTKTNAAASPVSTLQKIYRDGSGDFIVDLSNNNINPNFYDDGSGTLATVGSNNWTIQRFYFFGQNEALAVTYGQAVYQTIQDAESAIFIENPILSTTLDLGVLVGVLIVKDGAIDLTDSSTGKFIEISGTGSSSSGGGVGDMQKAVYDPTNNGYVDEAGKMHLIIGSSTSNGAISLDLDTFTNFDLELDGDVTSLNISNGELYQQRIVNIKKDSDGYYFDVANDYSESLTYSTGDVVGVQSEGSVLGRVYFKANQNISTPEVFDPAKWDIFIKMQDDVAISISYLEQEIDQLIITPKMAGAIMYYSITPIYNA